jgi:hypothetical protein
MATESQLTFETPACQDMRFGAEELNWGTEASEVLSAVQWSWKSGCEETTLCVLLYSDIWGVQLQWDCYSSCVKIRYQETTSGERNSLRRIVCVTVNCKVQISDRAVLPLVPSCVNKVSIYPIHTPSNSHTPKSWEYDGCCSLECDSTYFGR